MTTSQPATYWPRPHDTVTVALRVIAADDTIATIHTVVSCVDETTHAIQLDNQVIGFISRNGCTFVARAGSSLEDTRECGQSLLWDQAVAKILCTIGVARDL